MNEWIYVGIHLCMHVYMYECMNAYMHACVHACVYGMCEPACVRACVRVSVRLSLGVFAHNHAYQCVQSCTNSCTHVGFRVQGLGLGFNTYGTCHNRRVIPTHVHVDHAAAARSRLSSQVTPCAERLSLTRMHGTGEDDHSAREWP